MTNERARYIGRNGSSAQVGKCRPTNRKGGPIRVWGWWGEVRSREEKIEVVRAVKRALFSEPLDQSSSNEGLGEAV